jgi:hypothetical protein
MGCEAAFPPGSGLLLAKRHCSAAFWLASVRIFGEIPAGFVQLFGELCAGFAPIVGKICARIVQTFGRISARDRMVSNIVRANFQGEVGHLYTAMPKDCSALSS